MASGEASRPLGWPASTLQTLAPAPADARGEIVYLLAEGRKSDSAGGEEEMAATVTAASAAVLKSRFLGQTRGSGASPLREAVAMGNGKYTMVSE